jgi:hypothetical protein
MLLNSISEASRICPAIKCAILKAAVIMQLNKRRNLKSAFDELKKEECFALVPVKQVSSKRSQKSMDIEVDFDNYAFEQLYAGDSRDQIGFFDIQETKNKYTPDPIWSDNSLVCRYQRITLQTLATEIMENNGVPKSEANKMLKDLDFMVKVHQYLISLSNTRRIQPE